MRNNGTTTYVHGDWNAVCDVCGFEWKGSQLRKRWDGLMACPWDWEPRQPQDFVRAKPDRLEPPFTRTDNAENFVPGPNCTIFTRRGIAGFGVAGCAVAGLNPQV